MRRLVWFTLGFGAACALGIYLAPGLLALPGAAACILLFGLFQALGRQRRALAACALVFLGLSAGLCWFCAYDGFYLQPARRADGQTLELTLTARDYPVQTDYGCYVDASAVLEDRRYQVRLYLDQAPPDLEPGTVLTLPARLRLTTDGGSQEPTYHRSMGIFLLAYGRGSPAAVPGAAGANWPARARRWVGLRLEELFPPDTAGFAKALLLGDRSGLSYGQKNDLALAGISHVVAVSGMHLGILYALVYLLTLRHPMPSAVLGIPAAFLFAAVTGFTPSVTRAAVMLSLNLGARLLRRDYDLPTALALSALLILAWNPGAAASSSFQLSVGAVAGIGCFSRSIFEWMTQTLGGLWTRGKALLRGLAAAVSMTLGAMAFAAPLAALTFGVVSLLSPLTNLWTMWAVSLIFYLSLGACALSALWRPLGRALAQCAGGLIRYVLGLSHAAAGLPFGALYPAQSPYLMAWVGFALLLFLVFLLGWCRAKSVFVLGLALSLCLSAAFSWLEPLGAQFQVTVLDVGQGQCVLLQAQGRTFVVDCGGTEGPGAGEQAARYLLARGIARVDGLILTHFDSDHVSGAAQLLDRLEVEALYLPRDEAAGSLAEGARRVYVVEEDLKLAWGGAQVRIFAPLSRAARNESGLSVLFTVGEYDTLITGDMNRNLERRLLALHDLPDIELLVAGHHGSPESTGEALLEALQPEIVAISVGPNSYGHPAQEMLDRVLARGCQVFRTDQAGTLTFRG